MSKKKQSYHIFLIAFLSATESREGDPTLKTTDKGLDREANCWSIKHNWNSTLWSVTFHVTCNKLEPVRGKNSFAVQYENRISQHYVFGFIGTKKINRKEYKRFSKVIAYIHQSSNSVNDVNQQI